MFMTNLADAKARLSEYLERASRGERIVICRHNKPIAELRAVEAARTEPRPIGPLTGRPTFEIPPAFFEALSDDELEAWEGGSTGLASRSAADEKPDRYQARSGAGGRTSRRKNR